IFNNVVFSASTGVTLVGESITVAGDVTIEQGVFNPADYTVTVGGNWTNTVGTAGFTEGAGRVVFNSSSHQYCYGETFNLLELNRPGMDFIIPNSTTTTCQQLDWTDYNGELEVDGGTFIAYDLEENGIFGKYYITSSGGLLELYQDGGQYVDLNGRIVMSGGIMNVYGGSATSFWPYAANATITMSGGVLDFKDRGIYLYDSGSYSLTETLTEGTIRTSQAFIGNRTDYNPTGGTIELYGTVDADMSMGVGSNFYNVLVNKSATDFTETKITTSRKQDRLAADKHEYQRTLNKQRGKIDVERNDSVIELTRSNTINAASDLEINGNLYIDSGTLDLTGYNINVRYSLYNIGNLIVDSILDIGDDCYYNSGSSVDLSGTMQIGTYGGRHGSSNHYTGSTFNQTDGNYSVESIRLYNGSQFNGSGGYTHIYVDGHVLYNNIEIDDPDSYFYRFYVDTGAYANLYNCSYDLDAYASQIRGPLDINIFTMNVQYFDVYDDGNLIIDDSGVVNVNGNGPYIHNTGTLTMVAGSELNSASNIWFQTGASENVSGGDIYLEGNFTNT
ncbi:MAG: hypothetical protein KAS62_09205, partial [Candidatus Delongbacteria bacterium]|nr:hypothetical protein [Candidatus Delongbacteria bacterium]